MELGKESMGTLTLENGTNQKHMATASIIGKTAIDTKANGKTVLNMGEELTSLTMERFTQASMSMEGPVGKESIHGPMEQSMKENLAMD